MPQFKLHLVDHNGKELSLIYDNADNSFTHLNGDGYQLPPEDTLVIRPEQKTFDPVEVYKPDVTPVVRNKNGMFSDIRIFLGAKCNYDCSYCYQKDVRETEPSFTMEDVDKFLADLDSWYNGSGVERRHKNGHPIRYMDGRDTYVNFWGGEPLVYWKIIVRLVNGLIKKYPKLKFGMVSNGSLINEEIADFILAHDFKVAMSHDGPGQHLRGADPFDNPETKKAILRLVDNGRLTFNPTLSSESYSKKNIMRFFEDKLDRGFNRIGEGDFVELFTTDDKATADLMISAAHQAHTIARTAFDEMVKYPEISRVYTVVKERTKKFITAFYTKRSIDTVGTKCGMDRSGTMVVDRNGNMLLCHHGHRNDVENSCSSVSNVKDIMSNTINTANHWKTKSYCSECPIVTVCAGSCPFTTGLAHDANCRTTYYDILPIFANAVYLVTGFKLKKIEAIGENSFAKQFPDRLDPFGFEDNEENNKVLAKKVISIKQI